MEATPNNKKLWELVRRAETGLLVLPEFQRNFVWPRKNVESLLDSLLRGHYIGALLFLKTDQDHMPFGYRSIAGLKASSSEKAGFPEDLVLDGQQRITALHYAFAAPDMPLANAKFPSRYFLSLDKLERLEEFDDAIWSVRAESKEEKELRVPEAQYEKKILPFVELIEWEDWKQGYTKWLLDKNPQAVVEHFSGEQARWDSAVRRIRDAEVPVVTLGKVSDSDQVRIRQICDVFEKLNSTGLKLTVFDLMTARLYRHNIRLRGSWEEPGLWEQSLQDNPLLRQFAGGEPNIEEADPEDFGVLLLQTVSLLRDQEVRSKKMIELDGLDFERDWKLAASAMENALKRATSLGPNGFGVFDSKWLPSKAILVVLAALTAHLQKGKHSPSAFHALHRWYWSSVFSGRYTRSSDNIMYQDFQEMVTYIEREDFTPVTLSVAQDNIVYNSAFSLQRTSRSSGTVYRGVMNMVALQGARDFANNDNITFQILDDHHIFPKNHLNKKHGLSGDKVNTVVNRTLVAGSTNREIQDKSPSHYVKDVIPSKYREKILLSHLVGKEAQTAMAKDDYEAFLVAREHALISKIKQLIS